MFGLKRFDLRFRNMPWQFRDSFVGAANTDEKDVAMMKKRMARHMLVFVCILVLACALLAMMPVAHAERDTSQDSFLIKTGMDLAGSLQSIAADESVGLMYSSNPEILEICREMSAFDPSSPSQVILFSVDPEKLLQVAFFADKGASEAQFNALGAESRRKLMRSIVGALPSMVMAQEGASSIAASSILSLGEAYLVPSEDVYNQLLIISYEDSQYSCVVTFTQAGDGIVSVNATFIPAYEAILSEPSFLLLRGAAERTTMSGEEALSLIAE